MVALLAGFAGLVAIITHFYLLPTLTAQMDAATIQKQRLSALAMLMLAIVLVLLIVGMILLFRARRFFFSESADEKTRYIDAIAESARRMQDRRNQ